MRLGHNNSSVDHDGTAANNHSSLAAHGGYRSASTPPTSSLTSTIKRQQQLGEDIRRLQTPPPPGFNSGGGTTTAPTATNGLSTSREDEGGQGRRAESPSLHDDSPILASGFEGYDGAALRLMGSVSAPPPPGFVETTSGRASSSLWGHQESGGSNGLASGGGRTSSFTNLANLLGTGLAESMEDSTRAEKPQLGGLFPNTGVETTFESLLDQSSSSAAPVNTNANAQRHHHMHHQQQRTAPSAANDGRATASNNNNNNNNETSTSFGGSDLSFARQSRHAASRSIGGGGGSAGGNPSFTTAPIPVHLDSSSTLLPPMSSIQQQQQQQQQRKDLSSLKEQQDVEDAHHHQQDDSQSLGMFSGSSNTFQVLTRKDNPSMKVIMEPLALGRKSAPPQFEFALSTNDVLNNHHRMEQQQQQQQSSQQQQQQQQPQRANLRIAVPKHAVTTTAIKPGMSSPPMPTVSSAHNRSSNQFQEEVHPFVWDVHSATEPSRSLVIWNAYALHVSDIKMTCEAFGVLEAFRSDFADRGVIFVGYYDIRSAQYAAVELKTCLQRFSPPANESSHNSDLIDVQYCVPLNSSSANDESLMVLSHMPMDVDEETLSNILASYGSVRSLTRNGAGSGRYGNISSSSSSSSSYVVEFHNIQDAKQALLELESTQPWGADVMVDVGTRNPVDRKKGRELLALMGRWRQPVGVGGNAAASSAANAGRGNAGGRNPSSAGTYHHQESRQHNNRNVNQHGSDQSSAQHTPPQQQQQQTTTQLLLGPDGQYSYVVVHPNQHHVENVGHYHAAGADSHPIRVLQQQGQASTPGQHYVHGPQGTYVASVQQNSSPHMAPSQQHYWQHAAAAQQAAMPPHQYHQISVNSHQYVDGHSYAGNAATPYYAHVPVAAPKLGGHPDSSVSSGSASGVGGLGVQMDAMSIRTGGGGGGGGGGGNDDKDNTHLTLDIKSVDSGRDTRTSLMVRNIPNKYTQQMLLSELTENGHGPGKIDFFYLPIDFKNRCNRGYAFVNFVDFRDIVPFHRQYYGQHWKVFNSDKICDITYARIQGKTGMLKRFENSVLMEKDDEYKPLVFVSHGNEKGKQVQFPAPSQAPA